MHLHRSVSSDSDLLLQLTSAESSFLSAVTEGDLSSFESQWRSIHDVIDECPHLQQEILSTANGVADRVYVLAQSFIDINSQISMLDASFRTDMNSVLDSLSSLDITSTGIDTSAMSPVYTTHGVDIVDRYSYSGSAASRISDDRPRPKRYAKAERWLLQHLHAPFASSSVKKALARDSGVSEKSISDWLSTARRKIGWTSFSNRHFRGNRYLTQDCAHRVLIDRSAHHQYCEDILHDLEEIKVVANRLYSGVDILNSEEPSTFVKELESINVRASVADESRKRFPLTYSTFSQQFSDPCSTVSLSSRKRSRSRSEDSDATLCSEDSQESSDRPTKRGKSESSSSSSLSKASSVTACSSEADESHNDVSTPASSPTQSNIALEFFNGWMNDLSAESSFLPHDLADNATLSVLSRKRFSPKSDLDRPLKRSRIDVPHVSLVETDEAHNADLNSSVVATQARPPASTPLHSTPDNPVALSYSDETTSKQTITEEVNQIIAQLNFNIPPAPVPEWDTNLLGFDLEASLLDFSSFAVGTLSSSGLPDDLSYNLLPSISGPDSPLSATQESLIIQCPPRRDAQQAAAAYAPQSDALTFTLEPTSSSADNKTDGTSVPSQHTGLNPIPLSLSSLDFDFLEALGNAPQSVVLDAQSTLSSSAESVACLVDVRSSSEANESKHDGSDRAEKLERLDQLLAEAQKLQKEVFG